MSPLILSIYIASISTIFCTIAGIYFAYKVSKSGKKYNILDIILTLPMILSPSVIGFFILMLFSKNGYIGNVLQGFNISIIFTRVGAIIASIIVSFPVFYKTVLSTFLQIDNEILLSAKSLGISDREIFFKILLPLSKNGIITGRVLAFARSVGEFGATIMVAGNIPGKTHTISLKIYSLIQSGDYEEAYFWVFIVVCMSVIFLLLVNFLSSKKEV